MQSSSLIIVGAGPIGMLAALIAADKGIDVALFEKLPERTVNSRAIGITPTSLEIFQDIGLDEEFVSAGIRVVYSEAHGSNKRLGRLNFKKLIGEFPFILSIPQYSTESILEKAILTRKNIRLYPGYEVTEISDSGKVSVRGTDHNAKLFEYSAEYLIAADGENSAIRKAMGILLKGSAYEHTFLMGDFDDNTGWGNAARLYLTSSGSVESFPLPGKRRRYVLRTPVFIKENTTDFLEKELLLRAGVNVRNVRKYWESGFGVQHFIADRMAEKHIFYCGDSAHIMSPIGGQNMNTGFADAELAVWLIEKLLNGKATGEAAINLYNKTRKQAVKAATRRAGIMMCLGTSGGIAWSIVRSLLMTVVLHTPLAGLLAPVFTMQSIPFRNIRACRAEYEREVAKC